jgi:hypothetical protein
MAESDSNELITTTTDGAVSKKKWPWLTASDDKKQLAIPGSGRKSPISNNASPSLASKSSVDQTESTTPHTITAAQPSPADKGNICGKCGVVLAGQFVRALGDVFHLDCFTCKVTPKKPWITTNHPHICFRIKWPKSSTIVMFEREL